MPVSTSDIDITESYPSIRPSLNLNFARSRALDPRITFERDSVATYVGRDGLIKYAGVNEPRFDHDPDTLESLGLLIEESRTNYIDHYRVNSGNGWATNQEIIFSSTTEPAPDGSSDNQKMAATTDGGVHSTYKQVTGASSGTVHTFSVYMKSAGSDYGYIYVDTSGARYGGVAVQFSTGNTAVMAANGNGTQTATSVTDVGNGWYRLSVSGSFSNTTQHYCHIDVANDLSFSNFAGNGTDGIYVWGAQLEAGSVASSLIPTSGSAVTRAKDAATILGKSFNSFYNPNEWTVDFVFRIRTVEPNGANYRIWDINNNSNDGRLGALYSPNGFVSYFGFENGNVSFSSDDSGFNVIVNEEYHGALAYSPTSSIAFKPRAGVLGNEDTNVPLDGPTQLQIGDWYNDDRSMNGTIAKFVYYPKRLTNAQLLTITS